ncbi:MAG TPA: hypothetical protein VLB67_13280 [Acidimicrobiia bacterium]|nr:hypothetical protein [Acidimicrobiia bacterium]
MSSIEDAQRELRDAYQGASVGQFVSAAVWGASAATATATGLVAGIWVMLIAGFFIYPITQAVLKMTGSTGVVPRDNPFRQLSVTVPIVGPLMIPLVGAVAYLENDWFYPAMLLAMGAHYLPFSTLYGRQGFIPLGIVMCVMAVVVGLWAPAFGVAAAWATAAMLVGFGVTLRRSWKVEQVRA